MKCDMCGYESDDESLFHHYGMRNICLWDEGNERLNTPTDVGGVEEKNND